MVKNMAAESGRIGKYIVFLHSKKKVQHLFNLQINGVLAQLVERLVRNQKVTGSTPVYSTSKTADTFVPAVLLE